MANNDKQTLAQAQAGVMLSFAAGKPVWMRSKHDLRVKWTLCNEPSWNWPDCDYVDVNPYPEEWWLVKYESNMRPAGFSDLDELKKFIKASPHIINPARTFDEAITIGKIIHVKKVNNE